MSFLLEFHIIVLIFINWDTIKIPQIFLRVQVKLMIFGWSIAINHYYPECRRRVIAISLCVCVCLSVCLSVCLLLRTLGDSFVSLLVLLINNCGNFWKASQLQRNHSVKSYQLVAILKFLCFCLCQQKTPKC